ncbi:MAG: nucleotidyltransferase domain-containing protein [Chloroflexi bacterium]|nr:MAG: nucleotidyltransferase domain-containing protein [Chloroflexota bacterium]
MSAKPFDTSVLDAALERERLALERERRQVVDRVLHLLDRWGPVYGIRSAYLFGSVARPGRFRQNSDVDLAVEQIDSQSFFRAWGHLSAELGRSLDLVELAHCPFAAKIRREGIEWTQST